MCEDNSEFGKPVFEESTILEDHAGIDFWLDGVPWSSRKYRDRLSDYNNCVTITRDHLNPWRAEYDRLIQGENRALIYRFQYMDYVVVVPLASIVEYFERTDEKDRDLKRNSKEGSRFYRIPLKELDHVKALIDPSVRRSNEFDMREHVLEGIRMGMSHEEIADQLLLSIEEVVRFSGLPDSDEESTG